MNELDCRRHVSRPIIALGDVDELRYKRRQTLTGTLANGPLTHTRQEIHMEVTTEIRDGVAVVTMDDGKMNAITADALGKIEAALEGALSEADAIVLAGRPGAFCAGFDRTVMTGDDAAARAVLSRGGARICATLLGCPKPVVATSCR